MTEKKEKLVEQVEDDITEGELQPRVEPKAQQEIVRYSGPLPDAESFGKYEQVLPGAADRILTMSEKEQDKDIERGKEQIKLESKRISSVTFISVLVLAASAYAMSLGYSWVAITGFGLSVINIVSRLFLVRISLDKE